MDSFSEYSSADVDFEALAKEDEDGITLLLSYMMITNQMSAKEEKLNLVSEDIESIRAKYYTPMQNWTHTEIDEWFRKIDLCDYKGRP